MADLNFETALADIEKALQRALARALGKRLDPVATVVALRALASVGASLTQSYTDAAIVYCTAKDNCYEWNPDSEATDDGDLVIAPTDGGVSGRWLKVVTPVRFKGLNVAQIQSGIVNQIILHNGDFDEDLLEDRIFAQAPCLAIHFGGEAHEALSQGPGALYDYRVRFQIWSVSKNYRADSQASVGSGAAGEAAVDPGAMSLQGLVKHFLAGNDAIIDGIKYVEILGGGLERSDLAERVFVFYLDIEVRATLTNENDAGDLQAFDAALLQQQIPTMHAASAFDPANVVTLGYAVTVVPGLVSTPTTGAGIVGGIAVSSTPGAHTFAASSDTYRDLASDGTLTFVAVAHGSDAPPVTADCLRVGCTITDAANIVADYYLCATLTNVGPQNEIPNTSTFT